MKLILFYFLLNTGLGYAQKLKKQARNKRYWKWFDSHHRLYTIWFVDLLDGKKWEHWGWILASWNVRQFCIWQLCVNILNTPKVNRKKHILQSWFKLQILMPWHEGWAHTDLWALPQFFTLSLFLWILFCRFKHNSAMFILTSLFVEPFLG